MHRRMELMRYICLNVLGMLGLSCYILADTYFIAQWLGADGLAALNLAIPVYNLINGCGLMLGMGGGAKYSIAMEQSGKGNPVFTHTLCMGAALAVLFVLTGCFGSSQLTCLLGADEQTFAMSRVYLRMLLLCSPLFLANSILLCFVRNDGAPGLAMAGMVTGSLSNIVLDYLMIFRLEMGMFGAVLATCLAPVISMGVQSLHFLRGNHRFRPCRCRLSAGECLRILSTGVPSLVTEVSSGVVIIVFNLLMLRLAGNTGVAAYGIIANLSLVVIAVYTGISQGIQPLVSRYTGRRDPSGAWNTLKDALWLSGGISVLLYAGLFLFADPIATLFNSEGNAQLQSLAVEGLRLYFIGAVFAGWNILLCTYFPCVGGAKRGSALSLLRGIVLILPLACLLSMWWGVRGIWLAFPLTELAASAVGAVLVRNRKFRRFL